MKPKNFPARKVQRQLMAQKNRLSILTPDDEAKIVAARDVRTKKYRGAK